MKLSSYSAYRYNQKNAWRMSLAFNKKYDGDIIKKLESLENKQAYIKELIRRDIHE